MDPKQARFDTSFDGGLRGNHHQVGRPGWAGRNAAGESWDAGALISLGLCPGRPAAETRCLVMFSRSFHVRLLTGWYSGSRRMGRTVNCEGFPPTSSCSRQRVAT